MDFLLLIHITIKFIKVNKYKDIFTYLNIYGKIVMKLFGGDFYGSKL